MGPRKKILAWIKGQKETTIGATMPSFLTIPNQMTPIGIDGTPSTASLSSSSIVVGLDETPKSNALAKFKVCNFELILLYY